MGTYKTDWQLTETVMPEDFNRIEGNIKENNKSFNDFKRQYDNDTTEANKKIDRKADKLDVILKAPIRLNNKDLNTITEPGRYVCANCTNSPTTYGRMDILVWNEYKTAKWLTQIFYSDVNNKVYTRCSTNAEGTEYTQWAMMYSTTNKPTPVDIGAATSDHNHDNVYLKKNSTAEDVGARPSNWKPTWEDVQNKPSTFTPSDHNHDNLYLGKTAKAEGAKNSDAVNGRIFNWAYGTGNPTHIWGSSGSSSNMQVWDPKNITVGRATNANKADAVAWGNITNKPETFSPSEHYHDDRYLRDIQSTPLWRGYHHMTANETVRPSKPLSQCNNGWVIVWSDWDVGLQGQDWNFCYSYVPKNTPWNGGQNHTFPLTAGENSWAIKTLYIYDTYFKGNSTNRDGTNDDVVIRAVLEY